MDPRQALTQALRHSAQGRPEELVRAFEAHLREEIARDLLAEARGRVSGVGKIFYQHAASLVKEGNRDAS